MKLIDLSVLVENTPSEPMEIKVKRFDYYRGAKHFCRNIFWNKKLPLKKRFIQCFNFILGKKRLLPSDFPDKAFLSLDVVTMATHMGTHIDAPFHYGPRYDGANAKTVDELPLDWFYKPAVKLDLTHKTIGEYITIKDLEDALTAIDYKINANDIVLINTGVDRLWGSHRYFSEAPGMSRDATEWLIDQGVKVIGTDTYGFDRPFPVMLKDFWETGDKGHLWPAHFYGREREYIQIERLVNLHTLPSKGFILCCFPLKIKGLDASWVRAVAIVNEV